MKDYEISYSDVAKKYGTPLFIYNWRSIQTACLSFIENIRPNQDHVCYAVKANNNINILQKIFELGLGADVVSVGEFERALVAGCLPNKIVFSGVGKQDFEIERALRMNILSFNVESISELKRINHLASTLNLAAPVCLRINPNIDVETNPYIATGLYETKFGIAETDLVDALRKVRELKNLKLVGMACHIGSQITDVTPLIEATQRLIHHANEIATTGVRLEYINVGGGLGIQYKDEKAINIAAYTKTIQDLVTTAGYKTIYEPGRAIVGNAGLLLTKVVTIKKTPKKIFLVVDAAMNDLIRPALYEAYHRVEVLEPKSGTKVTADIVGPICETGDFLALDRVVSEPVEGSLVLIHSAGAYGMSMSSNYNTRTKAAEILVDRGEQKLIRRREKLFELWHAEMDL